MSLDFFVHPIDCRKDIAMEDSSFLTFQGHLDSALRLACAGISHTHPGHKFGPSVRSYYLIHYIFDGCGTFFTNGTSYHLHKGQGFLIRPGTQTTYQADETDPWSYVWIGFAGTLAAETVQNAGITPHEPIFHTDASDEIRNCITTLLDHSHTSAADHFYSLACFYRFMSYIALANKERLAATIDDDCVNAAIIYLQDHIAEPLTVQKLAAHVGLDRNYLTTRFREAVGQTPGKYIQTFRLTLARHLLESSDLSISEIAFRTQFRTAPSKYRLRFPHQRAET